MTDPRDDKKAMSWSCGDGYLAHEASATSLLPKHVLGTDPPPYSLQYLFGSSMHWSQCDWERMQV